MELPVPAQLAAQLVKCNAVRESDYYKSREKSLEVRTLYRYSKNI